MKFINIINNTRFIFLVFALSFSLLVILTIVSNQVISQGYENFMSIGKEARLKSISLALRQLVSAEQLERLMEIFYAGENLKDDEEYKFFRRKLIDFAKEHDVKFAYFMKRIDEDRFVFIIDNDCENPFSPRDTAELYAALRIAFETKKVAIGLEYEDGWEGLVAAFAPMEDTQGNFVFAAGVDVEDYLVVAMRRNVAILNIAQIIVILTSFGSGIITIIMFRKKAIQSEESSLAKSSFFATISHEIRTPLNSILGLSEIELNDGGLSNKTAANLRQIRTSGTQLLKTINQILDLSKIDTKKFSVSEDKYDSASFINDVITFAYVKYPSDKVEFKTKVSKNIPEKLFGDVLRMNKIIDNMLDNAFKYTIKGSVLVSFDFEKRSDKKEGLLIISVEDTGIGIKEGDLTKLTQYYSQIDANSSRQLEGIGIGLTISTKLAKLMKGNLNVESVFGKGSKFTLKIPQKIISEKEIGAKIAEELQNFSYDDDSKKKSMLEKFYMPYGKVLVVDDVQTNLDVAKGYMSIYGLQIDCVLSGNEAIEKIKSQEVIYDCIFMDHMMPEMDGIETMRKIRTEIGTDYAKNVPIIAFTANASVGNREMFLEYGFDDFVSKPIDSTKLDVILNKFIREKQNEQTLEEAERKRCLILESKENASEIFTELLKHTEIDGVNLTETLKKFSENFCAYFSAIQSFAKNTPELIKKIKEASPQNIREYAVIIHGIKGSCYGIGAKECGDFAKELEMAAKGGNFNEVSAKNDAFITKLEKIIADLQGFIVKIEERRVETDERKIEDKPSEKLLAELLDAAKDYNIDRMNCAMCNLNAHKYREHDDLVKELDELVRNFRYDKVMEKLNTFLGA